MRSPPTARWRRLSGRWSASPRGREGACRQRSPPSPALPPGATVLTAAGPFDEAAERALMLAHGVRMLVSKNSGGGATYAKIAAARGLGLPVVMVRRPPPPAGEIVDTVSGVLGWLARSSPV